MTEPSEPLYRTDAYARESAGRVLSHTEEGGVVLDTSLFYPTGGGQPGDSGWIDWDGTTLAIATTVKGRAGESVLVPAEPTRLPPVGAHVVQRLDWERRHKHMRVHTALHLLSVVIPLPVTGGAIGAARGRLDFMMPEPPDNRDALEDALNALIDRDLVVSESWITDAELDANPSLVKTMSVHPPRGSGRVRLVRIGDQDEQVDLQPCGGTHVARTGEIGRIVFGKIENKGKQNRRVNIALEA
ncbi:alanyl-tRNA editing protein [Marivita sp. XM-24bin2]|uniref:alanyl-tRNA editing protein n=1 Tax=unclassified Marivita TaxID=2632480 RepID=UPI000D7ABC71|nr:alanyl-tRNA editing protein [Marivita sp. XM-24bin2]MCR9111458.1 alanyl-tRNA editing protein [Paracoccaceae bacterium]PWL35269.1 MAG: Ala-tRNA(Pro) hydrolase [Marivita sp. XM-24bin2]